MTFVLRQILGRHFAGLDDILELLVREVLRIDCHALVGGGSNGSFWRFFGGKIEIAWLRPALVERRKGDLCR